MKVAVARSGAVEQRPLEKRGNRNTRGRGNFLKFNIMAFDYSQFMATCQNCGKEYDKREAQKKVSIFYFSKACSPKCEKALKK